MTLHHGIRINSLRSALAAIDAEGELVRITRPVDTGNELPNICRQNAAQPKRPALLFENPKGFPGWRVACAPMADIDRVSYLFGLPRDQAAAKQRVLELMDQSIPPVVVKNAPCQENVITEGIDIPNLIPWTHGANHVQHRYLQGLAITKDIHTQKQNLAIYRCCLQGPDTITVNGRWDKHMGHQLNDVQRAGGVLPVAYVLGPDPMMLPAAFLKWPYGADEWGFIGAVRGEPVEMVRCVTQDLLVPANAEVIIEGEIRFPYETGDDGPWPEYLRYLGMNIKPPLVHVTAVTFRNNPITYMTIPAGDMEHLAYFCGAGIVRHLRQFAASFVVDATMVPGAQLHHLVVQVRKTQAHHEGLQINVGLAAFGHIVETDKIILVDDDINIYDFSQVMWAEATRCNPAEQVHILPAARTQQNCPIAGVREMLGLPITKAKMIVDATIPWHYRTLEKAPGLTFFTKSEWSDVRLRDYLSPDDAERWVKTEKAERDVELVG